MTHDEIIEATAQSMRDAYGVACGEVWVKWAEADERKKNEWRQIARAAIREIAPAVLEEAAEEASIAWDAVNAIRAMKTRYEQ